LSSEPVERRLTAILAADVAGYSRLIGADEEGTLAQLKAFRKTLLDPTIAKHRGRIVKTTGDGMLVEFASAVDAVRNAVEIQRSMAEQNTAVPQDQRIVSRCMISDSANGSNCGVCSEGTLSDAVVDITCDSPNTRR
jgi:class 3 adenylate cyclase